eukprot:g2404.t1
MLSEYSIMVPVPVDGPPSNTCTTISEDDHLDKQSIERTIKELELEINDASTTLKDANRSEIDYNDNVEAFKDVQIEDTRTDGNISFVTQMKEANNLTMNKECNIAIRIENAELRELVGYLLPAENSATRLTSKCAPSHNDHLSSSVELKGLVREYRRVKNALRKENESLDTMIAETESSYKALLKVPNIHERYQESHRAMESELAEAHEELKEKSNIIDQLKKDLDSIRGALEREVVATKKELHEVHLERDQLNQLLLQKENEMVLVREECTCKEQVIRQLVAVASHTSLISSSSEPQRKKNPFPKFRKPAVNKKATEEHKTETEFSTALLLLENQIKAQEKRFQEHLEEVRANLRKEEMTRQRLEALLMEGNRIMNNIAFSCTSRLRDIQSSITRTKFKDEESLQQWIGQEIKSAISDLEKLRLMDLAKEETQIGLVDPPLDPKERKCLPFEAK